MFDFGLLKLAILAMVGLIVLGPERLPQIARMAGTLFGRSSRYFQELKNEVSRQIDAESLRELKDMGMSLNQEMAQMNQALNASVQDDIYRTPVDSENHGDAVSLGNPNPSPSHYEPARTRKVNWQGYTNRPAQLRRLMPKNACTLTSQAQRMKKYRQYTAHLNKKTTSFF